MINMVKKNTYNEKYASFGNNDVPEKLKYELIENVFDKVAEHYDEMNNLISFGLHHRWKHFTVKMAQAKPGDLI
ncbi:MAG: hypothetical protein EVG15_03190 [Candidatus Acididesulfobacter diazotrophicus]|uniref:Bifunctional demethylmenaquinone methyltransferase/2-methoxy-6-polyprenyl-1,4-benzoquinol methylase n=1 Tax=Candidatus Acididesulfobacter diazotrophicus TaxID=2597226 RepID=A0A519BPC1_9DELT|nr:MAG: hypothetical protein EVG15_03190 [Candidatus Acididesulfobacter diazotrophicus]